MTSTVDLRTFAYPLEPLLRKQQWRVDALEAKLAVVGKLLAAAKTEREAAQTALEACAGEMRKLAGCAVDPSAYGRQLVYLMELQEGVERTTLRLEQLKLDRQAVTEEYVQAQRKVDVTTAHKDECMKEYILSEQNRLSGEMDREWLAREGQARRFGAQAGEIGE